MVRATSRLAGLSSLVLAATLLAPAPAQATPTWQPVSDLSATGYNVPGAQVAANSAGTSIAIWAFYDGTHYVVETATRPAGGTWSNAALPRPDTLGTDFYAASPQIALDPAGNATAVWLGSGVQSASRGADGAWTTPTTISSMGYDGDPPRVGVDSAGNVTAIWVRKVGAVRVIETATRSTSGTWSAPTDLSATDQNPVDAQLVVDPAGNATAIWTESGATTTTIQAATRPAGGTWSSPSNLSGIGVRAHSPHIAFDPAGTVTAVWDRLDLQSPIQTATRPAGGIWSSPTDIPSSGLTATDPEIAFDASGNATGIWRESNGTHAFLRSASRPVGGIWSAPTDVSTTGRNAFGQRLVVDPEGSATVVWYSHDGTTNVVQASTRPAGSTWSTPTDLSAAGRDAAAPEIALDATGNATAVWRGSDGSFQIAQARGLDGAGPLITAFSAPTSGTPGQSLSYSVTATDVWSTISTIGWSFGDGMSASGASTSHTYSAPGAYDVILTLTDAVGNVTTRTTSLTKLNKLKIAQYLIVSG